METLVLNVATEAASAAVAKHEQYEREGKRMSKRARCTLIMDRITDYRLAHEQIIAAFETAKIMASFALDRR